MVTDKRAGKICRHILFPVIIYSCLILTVIQMDSGKVKPKAGMGVAVSTMANDEEELDDDEKTIFDWCKDGDGDKMNQLLKSRTVTINEKDEEVRRGIQGIHI